MKAYLHFTNKTTFRNGRNTILCWVRNVMTGEEFYLSFTNNCKMYRRICDINAKVRTKNVGEFKAYVSYFNESKNRVKLIRGVELRKFRDDNVEYFI